VEHDFAAMEALASGTAAQVERWVRSLRAAAIPFALSTPCGRDDSGRAGRTEVWVRREDSERARLVIRNGGDASLMW
jgi:hypothetical protein